MLIIEIDESSFTYENIHEVIGQLILSELPKKYSHPLVLITFDTDEVLYDKSGGFGGAEIEVKVFKHPYY